MPKLVVNGAKIQCSCGTTPASLTVLPTEQTSGDEQPAATIMDHIPMTNIPSFGMCTTPANPQVASATSAASGVLTPVPCVPMTSAPWTPGASVVTINNKPALTDNSKAMCNWTGQVSIIDPASQFTVE